MTSDIVDEIIKRRDDEIERLKAELKDYKDKFLAMTERLVTHSTEIERLTAENEWLRAGKDKLIDRKIEQRETDDGF
jgi:uncharacterized small protein (DUF1192 family)